MQIPHEDNDNQNEIDVNAILLLQLKWDLHQGGRERDRMKVIDEGSTGKRTFK